MRVRRPTRSDDDWDPLDFPNYGGLGSVSDINNEKGEVTMGPIGFVHFPLKKPKVTKGRRERSRRNTKGTRRKPVA